MTLVPGLIRFRPLRAVVSCFAVLVQLSASLLMAQEHPRLLFTADDIPALRERISREPFKTMYEQLLADAETGQYRSYAGPTPEHPERPTDAYGESVNAMRLGFLYVLTGADVYAQRARFYVERRLSDSVSPNIWGQSGQKGLNLYFNGKSVALAYDWCYGAPSWDAAFAGEVSTKLLQQANLIADNGGTEQNNNSASNWQGLRGSSAVLCFLASDEAYSSSRYSNMYQKTRNYLRDNLGTHTQSRGWNIEGIGYLGYPYATVIPAAFAAFRNNPADDMISDLRAMDYACWTQYAATVRFRRGDQVWLLHPDFGDDNATADDANGAYGFAFALSPPALIPGLVHWYQRLLVPENNWDYTRAGTIFSILYYPESVEELNPLAIPEWRDGFVDTGGNGFFTYRNQYRDEDDMVAQMYLKLRGNRGHNGPDALSFRILGLNTAWAVGGGRYGIKTNGQDVFWRSQNTLYPVDPDTNLRISGNSGVVVGTPVIHPAGDGHVVSRISRNNVNTINHQRWFAADHSRAAGVEALYIIADRSDDGFFWQFNTLAENAIEATADGFIIEGHDGASLKATFLYPQGELVSKIGNRVRGSRFAYGRYGESNNFIHVRGSGDYLVVLTVAMAGQTHPQVRKLQGRVAPAVIEVGPSRFAVMGDRIERDAGPLVLPESPTAVTGVMATASAHFPEILISWDAVHGASGYVVERSDDGSPYVAVANLSAASTSTVDNNLLAGILYRYRVKAWNDAGDGSFSMPALARVAAQPDGSYIAFEDFEDYPVGLIGGNNGKGGWLGPWSHEASQVVDTTAGPLTANGISGGNRALRLGFGDDVGRRLFASSIASSHYGDGIWFSYLLHWQSGAVGSDDSAWLFNTIGNRDWAFAGLGSNGRMRVSDWYNQGTFSSPVLQPGDTVQIVVRVTHAHTELWINPDSDEEAPLVRHNNSNTRGWRAGFPGIGISSRANTDVYLIDRIIVARSFHAIMSDPAEVSEYSAWQAAFSWPDAASVVPDADADGDGISNFAEFIHGSDPTRADAAPLQLRRDADGRAQAAIPLRNAAAIAAFTLQVSHLPDRGWVDVDTADLRLALIDGRAHAVYPLQTTPAQPTRFLRIMYP